MQDSWGRQEENVLPEGNSAVLRRIRRVAASAGDFLCEQDSAQAASARPRPGGVRHRRTALAACPRRPPGLRGSAGRASAALPGARPGRGRFQVCQHRRDLHAVARLTASSCRRLKTPLPGPEQPPSRTPKKASPPAPRPLTSSEAVPAIKDAINGSRGTSGHPPRQPGLRHTRTLK
jgi:hypothetical protein